MIYHPNLCRSCALLRADGSTCDAFPGGIPLGIRVYGDDHLGPVTGDNGIVYVKKTGREAERDYQDWLASNS